MDTTLFRHLSRVTFAEDTPAEISIERVGSRDAPAFRLVDRSGLYFVQTQSELRVGSLDAPTFNSLSDALESVSQHLVHFSDHLKEPQLQEWMEAALSGTTGPERKAFETFVSKYLQGSFLDAFSVAETNQAVGDELTDRLRFHLEEQRSQHRFGPAMADQPRLAVDARKTTTHELV